MGRQGKLSREKIVSAALKMLDESGERGFSMRKLAMVLKVDPMALYHHFAGRAALVHEVLQAMLEEFEYPPRSDNWRADIRALCHALRALALRHPGAFQLYERHDRWLPAELRMQEAFHATLLGAGFSPIEAVRAVQALLAYTEACAVDEITGWREPYDARERREFADELEAAELPALGAVKALITDPDPDADFAFGLDLLVGGLEAIQRGHVPDK